MCDKEQVITFRQPSTANLMIDSKDRRSSENFGDFQITKFQNLLTGFPKRIATSEVVLEWFNPNISPSYNNTIFTISATHSSTTTVCDVEIDPGFYTVQEMIDTIIDAFNSQYGTAGTSPVGFDISGDVFNGGYYGIEIFNPAPGDEILLAPPLTGLTKLMDPVENSNGSPNTGIAFIAPDLRPTRYIDFVSQQLTYCQNLKDSSTSEIIRDVLCRWYFATTNGSGGSVLDAYGYPILQGYEPFVERRIFNPPKQIKWDNIQPIGNLSFQLYNDKQELITPVGAFKQAVGFTLEDDRSNWLMTLQVSED